MGKSLKGKELGIGITQRKDSKYSAKFTSKTGKRIEKYFDKLTEARKWLEEAKYNDAHGDIINSKKMTVDVWFEYWMKEIKGKTVRWSTLSSYYDRYNKNIKNVIGTMVISDVLPMHCQNVLNIMDNQGYAGSSMMRTRATMNSMFSDAEENSMIAFNPVTKSVKCPKRVQQNTRVLTLDEQEKFLEAAKDNVHYPVFLFILQTGVRSGELRGLKWEDLDFENRIIHIRRSVGYDSYHNKFVAGEVKTGSGKRDIPMTQTIYHLLLQLKKNRPQRKFYSFEFADYVFLNRNGNLTQNGNYQRCLQHICKKAGIEDISMHVLRHTFATRCIETGMKPKTLQKILGHAKITMTMDLYVHVTGEEKEKEMKKFEEFYKLS